MKQENFDNMDRLWAVKSIINEAEKKCHELCRDHDMIPSQTVMDIMTILSDSANKATHIQWTDAAGWHYGIQVYAQSIKNL